MTTVPLIQIAATSYKHAQELFNYAQLRLNKMERYPQGDISSSREFWQEVRRESLSAMNELLAQDED